MELKEREGDTEEKKKKSKINMSNIVLKMIKDVLKAPNREGGFTDRL